MSAVSNRVMPASMAASTTARVCCRSSRPPKLLQPSPATDTSSPLLPTGLKRMTLPLLETTTLTLRMDGNDCRRARRGGVLANGAGDTIQKLLKWTARHVPFPS